jgi:hypothetical protein
MGEKTKKKRKIFWPRNNTKCTNKKETNKRGKEKEEETWIPDQTGNDNPGRE